MIDTVTTLNRTGLHRSVPALMGLLALVLLQFSAAAHQFEHEDEHTYNACQTCTALSETENVPVIQALPLECVTTTDVVVTNSYETPKSAAVSQFRSRAPPLF